ncbi:MAG: hypothetical protein Q6364_09445 [Candidatus Hermodarchaeota archaeon]|nr:hypothetical protein [Candidatus Hermodarchaeota archaeon]
MTSIHTKDATVLRTEKPAELPSLEPHQLKGYACYYLSPNLAQLTFPNTSNEIVNLRPGLYAAKRHNTLQWPLQLPNESGVLVLTPRRDSTKKPRKTTKVASTLLQRFVLILYKPFKSEFKRKQLSRLFTRTPLVRIRPGIVLAPQIRTGRFQLYQKVLLRPSQFIFRLVELGSPTQYASRLELDTSILDEKLETLIHKMFEKRVQRLVNACRILYSECGPPSTENKPITQYLKRFKRIRQQLLLLRWQSKFFKEELGVDIQRGLIRVASAVHRVHKRLQLCDT